MKACLYIGPGGDGWCGNFFPDRSPGELPLAGKSWCRHAVDLCSQLQATEVMIAECNFREELRTRLGCGKYWSLDLHISPVSPCAHPDALMEQLSGFERDGDELLIFWGQVLPDIAAADLLLAELRPADPAAKTLPDGVYLRREGRLFECVCPLLRMDSLKSYFDLNFRLLEAPGIYNLPGYSSENGCAIGMNVITFMECELERPAIIQDNVCLERGVHIHNGAIIGSEVLIDEKTELDHSLVLDHTYLGRNMFIRRKIVDGCRVIDADTGAVAELTDRFLAGDLRQSGPLVGRIAEWLVALWLCVVLLPWYLLTFPFRGALKRLAFPGFLLRVYPKCWQAVLGRANLVRCGKNDAAYAFRASDMFPMRLDRSQTELVDLHFYYHRSLFLVLKVVTVSLLRRLFMFRSPDREAAEKEVRS